MEKRKKYKKPEIKKVALTPEEAVLSFCKSGVGVNRFDTRCASIAACTNKVAGS